MPTYFKKHNHLLIVPNKCGSMYAEAVCSNRIIAESQMLSLIPAIEQGRISVTAVKRDPLDYYLSGYWHVSTHRHILPNPPARWTPSQHWRLALTRKLGIHKDQDSRFSDFDLHSWIDPWNQVYQTPVVWQGVRLPPHVRVNWIDLNSEDFVDIVQDFATDAAYINEKINQSHRVYWPMKQEYEIMLHQLDDWSWRLGYDLKHSIKRYRKHHR